MTLLVWFFESKVGRWILAIVTSAGLLALLLLRAFSAGKAAKTNDQLREQLDAVKRRRDLDATVDSLPDAAVDERLQRWRR
jgi:hypothetical protein